ncbi:aldose 1-epimerase family protein [Vagococcus lutrae]|uniref:aldose 1-epimerase family protein n=1 Tax=Vagococcus lutrae TaxID=81947 RepID=UPI002891D644|nr:aldose 1-epimerase family protein [Vagococcus lutrae]MDT2807117.1 aldose 1-epimerase family protein [Vagococcus lutrae]
MSYSIQNQWVIATFKTEGAELTSLKCRDLDIEYLWSGDATYWGRHAPVLFPIVGRLKDDSYHYQGQTYHMSQHGFARDKEFQVTEVGDEFIRFSLSADEETLAVYPFRFKLEIEYRLEQNQLICSYHVTNEGETEMFYSVGGHPAFNVPIDGQGSFADYYLDFYPMKSRLLLPLQGAYVDEDAVTLGQTNTRIAIQRELFKQDALIYQTTGENSFSIRSDKTDRAVTVMFDNMDFVGIWSPYPKEAPFVCIEPWQGIADTVTSNGNLEEKKGIQRLTPQASQVNSYTIRLD